MASRFQIATGKIPTSESLVKEQVDSVHGSLKGYIGDTNFYLDIYTPDVFVSYQIEYTEVLGDTLRVHVSHFVERRSIKSDGIFIRLKRDTSITGMIKPLMSTNNTNDYNQYEFRLSWYNVETVKEFLTIRGY